MVIAESGPSLIGRDWMMRIQLNWKSFGMFKVHATQSSLDDVVNRHPDIFNDELGLIKSTTAKIHIDSQSPEKNYANCGTDFRILRVRKICPSRLLYNTDCIDAPMYNAMYCQTWMNLALTYRRTIPIQ